MPVAHAEEGSRIGGNEAIDVSDGKGVWDAA